MLAVFLCKLCYINVCLCFFNIKYIDSIIIVWYHQYNYISQCYIEVILLDGNVQQINQRNVCHSESVGTLIYNERMGQSVDLSSLCDGLMSVEI